MDFCDGCYGCVKPCGRTTGSTLSLKLPAPEYRHCSDCLKSTPLVREKEETFCGVCRKGLQSL
jgi:hypothetical protein